MLWKLLLWSQSSGIANVNYKTLCIFKNTLFFGEDWKVLNFHLFFCGHISWLNPPHAFFLHLYVLQHDLTEMEGLIRKWHQVCQEGLVDLLSLLPEPRPQLTELIDHLGIDHQMIGYDKEDQSFTAYTKWKDLQLKTFVNFIASKYLFSWTCLIQRLHYFFIYCFKSCFILLAVIYLVELYSWLNN